MKIAVCVRKGIDGELGSFDSCAYEAALSVPNAEVILVSMGPEAHKDFLLNLTRLGAKKAYLISDKSFAGADTIATSYTLSLALKMLSPDLIFCGRQTFVGDTGQVGPMLASMLGIPALTNAMEIAAEEGKVVCKTREEGIVSAGYPALVTVERINKLRLPSIRSRLGEVEILSAEDIGADVSRCGLTGSPTRVIETYQNESGRRKCRFEKIENLMEIIKQASEKKNERIADKSVSEKLKNVLCVGSAALKMAESVSDDVCVVDLCRPDEMIKLIEQKSPSAVIFGSDTASKRISAEVAASLNLGLCADCTMLKAENGELIMYRPALAGSIIAKIKSLTVPAMATVRTEESGISDIIVTVGFGAKGSLDTVTRLAEALGATLGASRKAVDNDIAEYSCQVGLTGKTVTPKVYIAVGVSGAVHHIVGMESSGTVIAINPDKDAPIFDYADYGFVCKAEELDKII